MSISQQTRKQGFNIVVAKFIINYINWLMLGFFLIILVLLGYFVAKPSYDGYSFFTKEEIPLLNTVLEKEKENLEELKIQYQRKQEELLQVKLDKVEKLVAKDNDKTNIYLPIEKILKENNFHLDSIGIQDEGLSQFGEEQIGGSIDAYADFQVGEMTIVLDIRGGEYKEIKKLLTVFEKSLRLYDIVSLNFSPESFNRDLENMGDRILDGISYNIVLKTYYLMLKPEELAETVAPLED